MAVSMKETVAPVRNESAENHSTNPRIEYEQRREARLAEAAREMQHFRSVGFVRLASLAVGAVLLWLAFKGLAWLWVLLPVIVFFFWAKYKAALNRRVVGASARLLSTSKGCSAR